MALVREQVMAVIHGRLRSITRANGYTREVGTDRFFKESEVPDNVATPAVVLIEFDESAELDNFETYRCRIPISVGFIDKVRRGQDGDEAARAFMGEIQKAMGLEFVVSTTNYTTGASYDQTVQLIESGNSYAADNQMASGDIDYEVIYHRHARDPEKA